jgi:hypothetical protein
LGISLIIADIDQSLAAKSGDFFQFNNSLNLSEVNASIGPIQTWQVSSLILPSRGTPDPATTKGGGHRDSCGNWEIPLITLVPSEPDPFEGGIEGTNIKVQSDIALTTEARPMFWFYVPELPEGITHIDFEIQDQDQTEMANYKHQIPIEPNSTPGVVGFRLPTNAPALVPDTPYIWIVSVTCDPNNPTPFAEAWIEYTDVNLDINQLARTDRLRIYGEHGFLHEYISNLAWLTVNSPSQNNSEWVDFLQEINLEEISDAPIIQFPQD